MTPPDRGDWPLWALLAVRAGSLRSTAEVVATRHPLSPYHGLPATSYARMAAEASGRARAVYEDHLWQAGRLAEGGNLRRLR